MAIAIREPIRDVGVRPSPTENIYFFFLLIIYNSIYKETGLITGFVYPYIQSNSTLRGWMTSRLTYRLTYRTHFVRLE